MHKLVKTLKCDSLSMTALDINTHGTLPWRVDTAIYIYTYIIYMVVYFSALWSSLHNCINVTRRKFKIKRKLSATWHIWVSADFKTSSSLSPLSASLHVGSENARCGLETWKHDSSPLSPLRSAYLHVGNHNARCVAASSPTRSPTWKRCKSTLTFAPINCTLTRWCNRSKIEKSTDGHSCIQMYIYIYITYLYIYTYIYK